MLFVNKEILLFTLLSLACCYADDGSDLQAKVAKLENSLSKVVNHIKAVASEAHLRRIKYLEMVVKRLQLEHQYIINEHKKCCPSVHSHHSGMHDHGSHPITSGRKSETHQHNHQSIWKHGQSHFHESSPSMWSRVKGFLFRHPSYHSVGPDHEHHHHHSDSDVHDEHHQHHPVDDNGDEHHEHHLHHHSIGGSNHSHSHENETETSSESDHIHEAPHSSGGHGSHHPHGAHQLHHGAHHHQHQHHHNHYTGSHRHEESLFDNDTSNITEYATKYVFAECLMNTNHALPEYNTSIGVTGVIYMRQVKSGGPLEMLLSLSGFRHGANHSNHVHGLHVYETGIVSGGGDCSKLDNHYNPTNKEHGKPGDKIRHVGDLGNIECDRRGTVHQIRKDRVASLIGKHSILGRSMAIRKYRDDFTKAQNGNGGPIIACCRIELKKVPIG